MVVAAISALRLEARRSVSATPGCEGECARSIRSGSDKRRWMLRAPGAQIGIAQREAREADAGGKVEDVYCVISAQQILCDEVSAADSCPKPTTASALCHAAWRAWAALWRLSASRGLELPKYQDSKTSTDPTVTLLSAILVRVRCVQCVNWRADSGVDSNPRAHMAHANGHMAGSGADSFDLLLTQTGTRAESST